MVFSYRQPTDKLSASRFSYPIICVIHLSQAWNPLITRSVFIYILFFFLCHYGSFGHQEQRRDALKPNKHCSHPVITLHYSCEGIKRLHYYFRHCFFCCVRNYLHSEWRSPFCSLQSCKEKTKAERDAVLIRPGWAGKATVKQHNLQEKKKYQKGTATRARLPLSCCRTWMVVTNYVPECGGLLPGVNALTMLLRLHKIVHLCPRGEIRSSSGDNGGFIHLTMWQRAVVLFVSTDSMCSGFQTGVQCS